jgi:uncharacterized protein
MAVRVASVGDRGRRRAWTLAVAALSLNVLMATSALAAGRVALVIGVSRYDKITTLANPAKDAALLKGTLEKLGFRVRALSDPSRSDLVEAIGAFEEEAKDAEAAVVYYAGHGAMIDGVNYLLPRDASGQNRGALTGSSIESSMLSQALVGAKVVRLVILDACRNNPVASRSVGTRGGLARETNRWSTQVVTLMAAAPGEAALDGDGANSPFAMALTAALSRPGMTVGELPSFVQAEVTRLTESEQVPDLQGIWSDVHWVFDPGAAARPAAARQDAAKVKWEREQVFWQSIKDSDDPADFRAYLEAQDRGEMTGTFRKLAVNRLRSLEKTSAQQRAAPAVEPAADLVVRARDAFARADYGSAARDWTAAARSGSGPAMYNLGVMSLTGRGQPRDLAAAARWFKGAAEAGHAGGMVNYGLSLMNGFGVGKDEPEGFAWLQRAAQKGSPTAMGMVGEAYLTGRGVAVDPGQAAGWFQKAVDAGDGPSITQLADLYERGRGVPADARKAFGLYQKAAVSGDTEAMVRLGYIYEDGLVTARDEVQAATWYQRAAEAGNSEGMSSLAVMLENGKGLPQDYVRAASYYRAAASRNDPRGYLGLGSLTARGAGVPANAAEAVKLFQQAADRGSVLALRNLAIMYESGQGVAPNRARAIELYRQAAAAGDEGAQAELQRLGAR